ncbi:hypothetical protein KFL_001110320 [Klebsormidium nitens]|uniref:CCHC-type domain-containing protein n=1 Tax=Klebsormidium nitens TaxID=105231 RepID=A0A1Y1HV01_KLENI|nr:hypothetical protein KFL_001110320 [Klebsormidium nitens]|eukprot:GAQ82455.1 hypothetical protein KFL_001110320 [Klebsormidium nitens]
MDREDFRAFSVFLQRWEAFAAEWVGLPREKLWVNFLANNQEAAEQFGFEVNPADHWPLSQSGCLTDCVICDASEEDEAFAEFEVADRVDTARVADARIVRDPRTQESRGFGFITMATREDADAVVRRVNGKAFEGRLLTVEKFPSSKWPLLQASPKGAAPPRPIPSAPSFSLLEAIAEKASVGAQHRWVALWHVCRRLRWLVLIGEDPPEDVVSEEREAWVRWPGCRSTEGANGESEGSGGEEQGAEAAQASQGGWWEEEEAEMASGAGLEGRQRFSGKRGEGLTLKQFEVMVKGSLQDRFKKLQKDVGNPVEGVEFNGRYCIYLGEFLDNPAKLAHEREYEEHCKELDPVGALLTSLKRHFEDRKEGKVQEWVQFRREPGEELPSLLFRLKGLAEDLDKQDADQELVTKFVTSLDRRFAEQASSQAMAATKEPGGAYTLDEAYEAALRVQSINSRLRIARELAPKAVEATRAQWGRKPAVAAHAAVVPAAPQLGAAAPAAEGGSGACHNCGEVGHYRNGCPHPRRNSSGRGQAAGGRGGGGRGPRACFVCGETTHLAAQCAKRAAPAVAATAPSAGGGIDAEEFKAFQEWRAMSQAALAVRAEIEEEDDDCGWDELEYGLGAVALPLPQRSGPAVAMAAAGTRAGAEKARATRAARGKPATGGGVLSPPQRAGKATVEAVGTVQIAQPVDLAAVESLKARRDKAAAKERLARLPDHGRHVAPQGLNRLPKGFAVQGGAAPGRAAEGLGRVAGAAGFSAAKGSSEAEVVQQAGTTSGGWTGPVQEPGPALKGVVTVELGALLALAERAGLDLAAVIEMTAPGGARSVPRIGGTSGAAGVAVAVLSPIAEKARRARKASLAERSEGLAGQAPQTVSWAQVVGEKGRQRASLPKDQPESSRMAEERARGGRVAADAQVARELARAEEEGARRAREEQAVATSRDAELAMELVAREAQERGVDREEVLAAQEMGPGPVVQERATAEAPVLGKGKQREGSPAGLKEDLERGLAWERKLGSGQWRGAEQVADVTLQATEETGAKQLVDAAYAHTKAMACFAEGQPMVSPEQRGTVEKSPDWVDNAQRAVQVVTPRGLVAPHRVLIDGGNFYSMAGAKLKAQLGLRQKDMDAVGHRVHTATGRIEALQGGLTKRPVPIVLNAGTPEELTLYERLAITDSTGYDLLVGTRAAYPPGLSVDRWQEKAVYRADWEGAGQKLGVLPMRLHRTRAASTARAGQRSQASAALACCLTR